MFERILAPLDGSGLAECILPHLLAMIQAYEADVSLVRVLELDEPDEEAQAVSPLDWELNRAEAESYLSAVADRLAQDIAARPKRIVDEGLPAQRIIELAADRSADLIMLSSHGRSGLSRWNVNSVVHKILQQANRSTFVARAYHATSGELTPARYRRIFVPLDGSRRAECVLSTAETLARHHGATLLIGHIVRRPSLPTQVPPTDEDRALVERYVERGRELGQSYLEQLRSRLSLSFEGQVEVDDDISESLHRLAEDGEMDLVILSAHGQSGKSRWPFGSITTSFIEYGSTPLLIIQDMAPEDVQPTKAAEAAQEKKGH
jgi:nucleotide-binding universal stress UspA family protein